MVFISRLVLTYEKTDKYRPTDSNTYADENYVDPTTVGVSTERTVYRVEWGAGDAEFLERQYTSECAAIMT